MSKEIKPWLTAIHRRSISSPLKCILKMDKLPKDSLILDYGCGYGYDLNYLNSSGFKAVGYDKYIKDFSSDNYQSSTYDIINCFYVLNVIPTEEERITLLQDLIKLLKNTGKIYIAVRSIEEFNKSKNVNYTPYNDGIITSKSTFQKYFTKEYLHDLIHNNFKNVTFTYLPFTKETLFIELKLAP